jgi:xanthine dehydrogenase accessory factor
VRVEPIYDILDKLRDSDEAGTDVLATIIKVDGSAYRKEGAVMLIQSNGSRVGLLSAGCLEEDLTARIQSNVKFQGSETIIYDMSSEDDLSWGQGAGCNGILYVLLESINPILHTHLSTLHNFLEAGFSVNQVRKLNERYSVTDYLFAVENGVIFGEWSGDKSQVVQVLNNRKRLNQKQNGLLYIEDSAYYFQSFQPKSRLILFGAGDDAIPLAKFASETGFSVLITDWRPGLCNHTRFPRADQLLVGTPNEIVNQIALTPYDSVIILSHVFQKDKEFFRLLQCKNTSYIGILGSKTRTKLLLEGIDASDNIYSPVGLSIGAEGPEEIAISIIAELIKIKRKQT